MATMALKQMTGFETGLVPSFLATTGSPTTTAATDQKNAGAYALKLVASASAWVLTGFGYTAAAATDTMIAHFAVRVDGIAASPAAPLATLVMGTNSYINLTLNADGSLTLRRNTLVGTGGTVLGSATAAGVITVNTWHTIEIKVVPSDAAGVAEVWVDGTRVINATSTDTQESGVNTTRNLQFGRPTANSGATWLDDIVLCDQTTGLGSAGVPGPCKIEALAPTADAVAGQLVGSDSNSTDNYALIDDVPVSGTDYIESSTVGHRDRYTLADRTHTGAVLGVQAVAVALNPDGGAASLKVGIRGGSSENLSGAKSLTASAGHVTHIAEVDPATSAAFTTADVNSLQLILEVA